MSGTDLFDGVRQSVTGKARGRLLNSKSQASSALEWPHPQLAANAGQSA